MIVGFKHRGLKRLHEADDRRRLPPDMVDRIRLILFALDTAERIEDLNVDTFALHPLKGGRKGFWAIKVRANWRSCFDLKRAT